MTMPREKNISSENSEIVLGLLEAIDTNADVSQRVLANELGVALGLVNSYLKRSIHKGWIKVTQAPANRYVYYLTPKGFSEKSRLATEYFTQSFRYFREARDDSHQLLEHCEAKNWTRIALCGATDLAEIFSLCANPTPVNVIGVYDPDVPVKMINDIPVSPNFSTIDKPHAAIVSDLYDPKKYIETLKESLNPERILVMPVLGLNINSQFNLEDRS